ncbi:hypothetical protein LBMAG42_40280 [Deltaproteobacteria bacterium]|nr:hypothetical protein LBMAG42_40280 [Deltaproteobacteria bacterium]
MAKKHDAKRAAKKHAKEQKRKRKLESSARPGSSHHFMQANTPTPFPPKPPKPRIADPEVEALLDLADAAVHAEATRLDAVEALLAADVFLAAEGGESRFERADLLDDVARLWLVAEPRTLPASVLARASTAITRVLATSMDLDLQLQLRVAHDDVLFLLGRGDVALDRILSGLDDTADLGYAVDVVLDCEGSTPANIRRVLDACIEAARESSPEGSFARDQIQYLEEALAELEAPVATV